MDPCSFVASLPVDCKNEGSTESDETPSADSLF